jgi:hypothetical protein
MDGGGWVKDARAVDELRAGDARAEGAIALEWRGPQPGETCHEDPAALGSRRRTFAVLASISVGAGEPSVQLASSGSEARTQEETADSELTPIQLVAGMICRNEEASWLVDPFGLSLEGDAIGVDEAQLQEHDLEGLEVTREWQGSTLQVVLARVPEIPLATYRTTIRIVREEDGSFEATGAIAYSFDGSAPGGLPPSGVLSDLSGTIRMKAEGWGEGAAVCLRLHLHGRRGESVEWMQGRIALP